jgi:hypothetical protein
MTELEAILAELGPDEHRVILVLARRLLAGQHAYGRLDVATDGRDWRRERADELADALVYWAIEEVAAMRLAYGNGAPLAIAHSRDNATHPDRETCHDRR